MFIKSITAFALALLLAFAVQSQAAAQEPATEKPLPLSNSPSVAQSKPLTFAQQNARFAAEQRMLRMEWNNWIGYSPLRPNMNASYMSNGFQRYYIPARASIVSGGTTRSWYW